MKQVCATISIYSKIENSKLLHLVNRIPAKLDGERQEITPHDKFLQLTLLNVNKGRTFAPHRHIWKKPTYDSVIAQESWIVIRGKVKAYFYDIDEQLIATEILSPGDCSMTFEGGHSYEILEENTVVYEYKTGPYLGQKLDKVFLGEQE